MNDTKSLSRLNTIVEVASQRHCKCLNDITNHSGAWTRCVMVKRGKASREEDSGLMVDALARLVGRDDRHVQAIHLMELLLFGDCRSLHPHIATFAIMSSCSIAWNTNLVP